MKVPKGHVLLTSSSDDFTYETFWTPHNAGEEVSQEQFENGELLKDGETVTVTESFRNDGPGEDYSHTITEIRITNKKGKAKSEEISKRNQ